MVVKVCAVIAAVALLYYGLWWGAHHQPPKDPNPVPAVTTTPAPIHLGAEACTRTIGC